MGKANENWGAIGAYSALIGAVYVLVGLLEAASGLGIDVGVLEAAASLTRVSGDVFGGLVLVVIGLVYLRGASPVVRGDREGVSYVAVGALMASMLLAYYALNAFSNGLGYVLGFEDWLEWTLMDEMKPGAVLWLLAIPSVLVARDPRWRD